MEETNIFKYKDFMLNHLIQGNRLFDIFYSEKSKQLLKNLLAEDLNKIDISKSDDASLFFSPYANCWLFYDEIFSSFELLLQTLLEIDKIKYENIHKGAPFYYLGLSGFINNDFEKAIFYMNAAVNEDLKFKVDYQSSAALKFIKFDIEDNYQLGYDIVRDIREIIEKQLKKCENITLTLHDIIKIFSLPLSSLKQTILTTFISFHLEFIQRKRELILVNGNYITTEPLYMHLLKGAVLFENLIANSDDGMMVKKQKEYSTLKHYYNEPSIKEKLISSKEYFFDNNHENDLPKYLHQIMQIDLTMPEKVFGAMKKLRDIISHNLLDDKIKILEYEKLYDISTSSMYLVIERLYKK